MTVTIWIDKTVVGIVCVLTWDSHFWFAGRPHMQGLEVNSCQRPCSHRDIGICPSVSTNLCPQADHSNHIQRRSKMYVATFFSQCKHICILGNEPHTQLTSSDPQHFHKLSTEFVLFLVPTYDSFGLCEQKPRTYLNAYRVRKLFPVRTNKLRAVHLWSDL